MSDQNGINMVMGMRWQLAHPISSMLMNGVCRVIIVFFIAVIKICLRDIYSALCLVGRFACQLAAACCLLDNILAATL